MQNLVSEQMATALNYIHSGLVEKSHQLSLLVCLFRNVLEDASR